MNRPVVVAEARSWIGTPYRHQASAKHFGCDCLGLLRGVWREVFGAEPAAVPPYSRDWDEVAKRDVLLSAAETYLVRRETCAMEEGDVILFRMREEAVAKHLGIATDHGFVHAYARHGVVENALSAPWRRRIVGVFAFSELNDKL